MAPIRILVVDDDEDVRSMLRVGLGTRGWVVEDATSGAEAVALCHDDPPDVVVLDYWMGGFSGMQVARQLKGEGFNRPIVIYSSYLSPSLEAETQSLGIQAVGKADVRDLIDTLEGLIDANSAK